MRDTLALDESDVTVQWAVARLWTCARSVCALARRVLTRRARRVVAERQLAVFDESGDSGSPSEADADG
jgi:hypothetical protein